MTKKCIKNFCHNEKMYLSSSLIRCSCVWKPKVPCLSKAARFIEELVESRQSLIRFRHLLLYGSVMSRDLTNVLFFFFNIRVFTGIHDVANFSDVQLSVHSGTFFLVLSLRIMSY